MITIDVEMPPGVRRLIEGLPESAMQSFRSEAFPRLGQVGSSLQMMARALAPVRTGRLRSSIELLLTSFPLGFDVSATAPYAGFVEFGTRRMAPRPYMRPALDSHIFQIERAVLDSLMRAFRP